MPLFKEDIGTIWKRAWEGRGGQRGHLHSCLGKSRREKSMCIREEVRDDTSQLRVFKAGAGCVVHSGRNEAI